MNLVHFDSGKLAPFVHGNKLKEVQAMVSVADSELRQGTGAGNDFRGRLDLPINYDKNEFARIKKAAEKVQSDFEALTEIGVNGSYLDAQTAIRSLSSAFYGKGDNDYPTVVFCGNSISDSCLADLIDQVGDKDFSINVISKSDTAAEPSIVFRILRAKLIEKYGKEEANKRTYATTNRAKDTPKAEANARGYEEFVVPDNLGGRLSVLSVIGLLPIVVAGGDIDKLAEGAAEAREDCTDTNVAKDSPYQHIALRNILYEKGYTTELFESYEPTLRVFSEWWKQLMGESRGKDQKGIYPSSASFSANLRSLGQYVQEGRRSLMETVVKVENPHFSVKIPSDKENLNQFSFLAGKTMNYVNDRTYEDVVLAHTGGGVLVITVNIPDQEELTLDYLICFFELVVGISGYLNGINPLNQPSIEEYKHNMFGLLNKLGYEGLHSDLTKRL